MAINRNVYLSIAELKSKHVNRYIYCRESCQNFGAVGISITNIREQLSRKNIATVGYSRGVRREIGRRTILTVHRSRPRSQLVSRN